MHLPGWGYTEHDARDDVALLLGDPLEQRLIVALLNLLRRHNEHLEPAKHMPSFFHPGCKASVLFTAGAAP